MTTTQLHNGMTVETLIFSITCILEGALDIIQMGLPDSVSNTDREVSLGNEHGDFDDIDLTYMTDWERGAVDGAIAAVSIIGAQTINDGIGNGDADMMLGDFSAICSRYVASNWQNNGDDLRQRIKRKAASSPNGWHASDVYLDYPDANAIAKRFVTELGLIP
jgi:hypothetical protein